MSTDIDTDPRIDALLQARAELQRVKAELAALRFAQGQTPRPVLPTQPADPEAFPAHWVPSMKDY
jgi:hypothetical protein